MSSSLQHVKKVNGIFIPVFFSTECFLSALQYQPKKGDVFVATYPKCGTTWMQNLVINILRKGEPLEKPRDFFLASPFLDQFGCEAEKLMIRPGAYKTHLPFDMVPWSDDAKYIYIARNPKDCCISFYHHMKGLPVYQFHDGNLDEFLHLFVEGKVEFSDYFDNLLSWYNNRNASNILFLTYEEMKEDLGTVALKVANFLSKELNQFLIMNPLIFERILHNCSFDVMKTMINEAFSSFYTKDYDALLSDPSIPKGRKYIIAYNASLPKSQHSPQNINFVREGQSGGWKNLLSDEQNKLLDKRIYEKTKDADVMSLWSYKYI